MFRLVNWFSQNSIIWVTIASAEVKYEWDCIHTPSLCFHGVERVKHTSLRQNWKNCSSHSILWKGKIVDEWSTGENLNWICWGLMKVLFRLSFMEWLGKLTDISVTASGFCSGIELNITKIYVICTQTCTLFNCELMSRGKQYIFLLRIFH